MAGRIQKPWDQLQDQRPSRRRVVYIPPPRPWYDLDDEDDEPAPGDQAAIDVAIGLIERAFGQVSGRNDRDLEEMLRQAAAGDPRGGKRRYTPRARRQPNEQRRQQAAGRPRDATGRFLPRQRPDDAA